MNRSLMGLLVLSVLLILHTVPGGRTTMHLSGFGACGEPMLAAFANCGRFDPEPSYASTRSYAPAADDEGVAPFDEHSFGVFDDEEAAEPAPVRVMAPSAERSIERGSLARDRDLSAAAVARAPGGAAGGVCDGARPCQLVQVSLR